MIALVVSILGLFVGPLLVWAGRGSSSLRAGVDGLATSLVVGASAIWLLPHAFEHGGPWALLGVAVGVLAPLLAHRFGAERRWAGLGLALLGLHVVLDGAALAVGHASSTMMVAIAVAAHRVPVGMAVAYRSTSQARAAAALAILGLLTAVGFAFGSSIPFLMSETAHGVTEAAIVGVLLHVVLLHEPEVESTPDGPILASSGEAPVLDGATFAFAAASPLVFAPGAHGATGSCDPAHGGCGHDHGHAHHHHGHPSSGESRASAAGVLVGIALLVGARVAVAPHSAGDHIEQAGEALLTLSLTSAPAVLLGFVFAGLVSALIQPVHVQGGGRIAQAVRGVVFGLPLPICSCGVVPMYQSLIRRGVPVTAGLAFLVATPELGLDAVLLSLPLLGLPLTVARVVAAVVVALAVAWLVASPGDTAQVEPEPVTELAPLGERLREGLRYGLVELVDHTLPWVVLGICVAALAEPLVDHEALATVPPLLQVPLAAVVGVPLYVCASGATPLAAVAVHKGLSAGAALTFLLAGPASNVTTFGVLSQLHGRALALRFGGVLTVAAVLIGWTVDWIGVEVPAVAHPGVVDAHHHGWLGWVCLAGVVGLGLASLFRMGARGVLAQVLSPVHVH